EQLRNGVRAVLSYLSEHPSAAHLLTVGILSCGPRGAHRFSVTVDAMRKRLQRCGEVSQERPALATVLVAASMIGSTFLPGEEFEPSNLHIELVKALLAIDSGTDSLAVDRISVGESS